MKNMPSKSNFSSVVTKFSFVIGLLLMCTISAHAQVDPSGDTEAPIDGGITLLVGAGVAYGIKEWQKKKGDEQQEKEII